MRDSYFHPQLEPLEKRQLLALVYYWDNWLEFGGADGTLTLNDQLLDPETGITAYYGDQAGVQNAAFGKVTNATSAVTGNGWLTAVDDGVAYDHQYIQSAIKGASDGDVVTVLRGTYTESDIVIDKAIYFWGEGRSGPTETLIVPEAVSAQGEELEFPDGAYNGIIIYSDGPPPGGGAQINKIHLDGSGNTSLTDGYHYHQGITTFYEWQNGPGGGAHGYETIRTSASGLQKTLKLTVPHSIASENTTTEVITTDDDHNFDTGDEIVFNADDSNSLDNSLSEGTRYFVRELSSTTFEVYATYDAAVDEPSTIGRVNLVGGGSGDRYVMLATYYGGGTIDQNRLEPYISINDVQVENVWYHGITLSAPRDFNFGVKYSDGPTPNGQNEVSNSLVENVGSNGNQGPNHIGILLQNLDDFGTGDNPQVGNEFPIQHLNGLTIPGGNAYFNTVENAGIGIASNAYGTRSWDSSVNARNDTSYTHNTVKNAVTAAYRMEFLSGGNFVNNKAYFAPGNTAIGIHNIHSDLNYINGTFGDDQANAPYNGLPFIGMKIEDSSFAADNALPFLELIDLVGPGTTVSGSIGILADNTFGTNSDTSFRATHSVNVSGFETGVLIAQSNASTMPTTVFLDRLGAPSGTPPMPPGVSGNGTGIKFGANHASGSVIVHGQFNTGDDVVVQGPGTTILGQFLPSLFVTHADELTNQPTPPPSPTANGTPPPPTVSVETSPKPDTIRTGNLTLGTDAVFTPQLNGDSAAPSTLVLEDFDESFDWNSASVADANALYSIDPWNEQFKQKGLIGPGAWNGSGYPIQDGMGTFFVSSDNKGAAYHYNRSTSPLNVRAYDYLQIIARRPSGFVSRFFVGVMDLDGTTDIYQFAMSALPTTTGSFATLRQNLLTPAIRVQEGDGVMNLSAIAGWIMSTDWSTANAQDEGFLPPPFGLEINDISFVKGPRASKFDVTGSVNLNGAILNPSTGALYASSVGQTFTIIDNDTNSDAVTGTFAGLPEGAALAVGSHHFTISYTGGDGNDVVLTQVENRTVEARYIFYNHSAFDGNDAAINASDDTARDTSKSALLPGGTGAFANVTPYDKGINGIMIDLAGGGDHTSITATDFVFKVGNNNSPSTWSSAPSASAVSVRTGAGESGSDRVEITWTDGSITNTWLEVQVLSTLQTGLPDNFGAGIGDVFFFGNKVGDGTGDLITSVADAGIVFENLGTATVTNRYDYDKSAIVNVEDAGIAFNNFGAIAAISPSSAGPFGSGGGTVLPASVGADDSGISSGLALLSASKRHQWLPASVVTRLDSAHANVNPATSRAEHTALWTATREGDDEDFTDTGNEQELIDELLDALTRDM